jgi:hypothetical protein
MHFQLYTDVKAFYQDTYDLFMLEEAQNIIPLGNLVIGNAMVDKTDWRDPANWFMATVADDAGKLTLHDPLAAACVFHEELCTFERGFVSIEIEDERTMAATHFTPVADGNIELARSVDVEKFYAVLNGTLHPGETVNKQTHHTRSRCADTRSGQT